MKITPVRGLVLGAMCALVLSARAQVVELRATINAAQEVPATSSPATGSAIMLYDVSANTFDLMVTINNMANPAISSHIHEQVAGQNGSVVTNLGSESVYTRSGNTLTATFRNVTHAGDRVKLINGGSYFNIHSAQFPGGEVRGQLIPQPVRLYANMDVAQEQAAFPAVNLSGLNDFGGAVVLYDPMTNRAHVRMSLFNFNNTFNNSHFHAGAPGVSGGVVVNLGNNASAGNYTTPSPGYISGTVDNLIMQSAAATPVPIDPIALLTGQLYLNFHSTTFTGGELRGQVLPSRDIPSSRLVNVSTRGSVGTGAQVLIAGISITGPEPVRVLITAKGPSLTPLGVTGALTDPVLNLHDSAGRRIATNDNVGTPTGELAGVAGVPTNSSESALLVVLPPGTYTAIVSGANNATGVALVEAYEVRTLPTTFTTAAARTANGIDAGSFASRAKAALELCTVPLATVTRQR